jgi:hypothetical protein
MAMAKRAKPTEVELISEKDFRALVRTIKSHQSQMDESRGSLGNAVMQATRKKSVNKWALRKFMEVERMADNVAQARLLHFVHYLHVGGVLERISAQMDLGLGGPDLNGPTNAPLKRKRGRPRKTPQITETTATANVQAT